MGKRILVFSVVYLPEMVGGAEIAVKEITDRIPRDGYTFDMITLGLPGEQARGTVGALNIFRIGWRWLPLRLRKYLYPFLACLKAGALHRRHRYDAIWAIMANYAGFAALFFKWRHPGVPFLLTLQEGDPIPSIMRRVFPVYPLFLMIFRHADRIQAISHYLAAWARQMGAHRAVEVIPNGVDLDRFHLPAVTRETERERMRKRLGFLSSDTVLVTTSRLVPKNAVADIIRALTFLSAEVKLLVVGGGELFPTLKRTAGELGLSARVSFTGFVPHEAVPTYLHAADIFVRPSRSEGMGNSFIEAMAAGLPVIGTPVGGILDFLKDHETGLFAAVEDPRSIAQAVTAYRIRGRLREEIIARASRMVVERYGWRVIAEAMQGVFSHLVALRPAAPVGVLVATPLYPPDIGGPATYTAFLKEELPKHGMPVTVVAFGPVRRFPRLVRHVLYFFLVLRAAKRVAVIFAQDPVSVGLPSLAAATLRRKRFILKVVGDYAWEQFQQKPGVAPLPPQPFVTLEEFQKRRYDWLTECRRSIERFVARQAEQVIVPSDYLNRIVRHWGVSPQKVRTIYNEVGVVSDLSSKEKLRTKLHLSGKVAVSAGRFVPWKGFSALLDAVAVLVRSEGFHDLTCLIVGDGPERKNITSHIEALGIASRVRLVGRLPRASSLEYLKAADLFVLNSRYEGFSHQIIEAMVVGTPVVTTAVGGNSEIIQDGVTGILIEPDDRRRLADAMKKVLTDPSFARRLAENAKDAVTQLSSRNRMIPALLAALRNAP